MYEDWSLKTLATACYEHYISVPISQMEGDGCEFSQH